MTTETLTMSDGVLTLTREGRKLVKVSFRHNRQINMDNSVFANLKDCKHCGTLLDCDDRGVWRDLADRFLCRQSPTCMHAAE